jgi:hypothetical protein
LPSKLCQRRQGFQGLGRCDEFRDRYSLAGDHDFLASLGSIDQIGKLLASLLDADMFHEFTP